LILFDFDFSLGFQVNDLGREIGSLLESSYRSDVTFKVEQKLFHLHKFLLKARIPYFEAMFSSSWNESNLTEVIFFFSLFFFFFSLFSFLFSPFSFD